MMKPPISIRAASAADAAHVAQLMAGLGHHPSADEIARRWALVPDTRQDQAFLAVSGQEALGLIAVHVAPMLFYPKPVARITTLVVRDTAKRQGVGRALVERALHLARQSGCDGLEVTTAHAREDAQAFYASAGFESVALRMRYTFQEPAQVPARVRPL